jgi:hypothetical protein
MSLTTYCDFGEVRSALGVNDIELSDLVLGLPVYEMGLIRELNRLSTSLNAAFLTIYAKTRASRTPDEAELHDSVRLFSVYAAAKQVGVSLANFAPKDVGMAKPPSPDTPGSLLRRYSRASTITTVRCAVSCARSTKPTPAPRRPPLRRPSPAHSS